MKFFENEPSQEEIELMEVAEREEYLLLEMSKYEESLLDTVEEEIIDDDLFD